jgi:CheY-like chemotaxis protein
MNVLIIEDDQLTLNLLKYSIESYGHEVSVAENAEEALSSITSCKFDLIFSDIMMPGTSGLSLLTALRTTHFCSTSIIAMSSLNNKPLLDAAYKAGANDFMVKPFTEADLSEKLNKFSKGPSESETK